MSLKFVALLIIISIFDQNYATDNQTNIDVSTCRSFVSRRYSYSTFYHILSDLTPSAKGGYFVDFHFAVKAPRDAHVLLSESSNIKNGDDVYEIVLGAGNNRFCDIRRKQLGSSKASSKTPDLLSAFDNTFFWVRLSKDGILEVGKEGEELAFLSWKDPQPLQINYISLCSWSNVEAKWLYDCRPLNNDSMSTTIVEEPKRLTSIELLRRDLLSDYDPYLVPLADINDYKIVLLHLTCQHVTLEEQKAILNVGGVIQMYWKDEKIKWNPENYGNITTLHLAYREIWQPALYLYNAVGTGADILSPAPMVVHFDGSVQWSPPSDMRAWCRLKGFKHWPADEHTCELQLGFWTQQQYLELMVAAANGTEVEQPIGSEWMITKVNVMSDAKGSKLNLFYNEYYEGMTPSITISLTLRRRNPAYMTILSIPLYFTTIMALLTFWISGKSSVRITSCCLQMIILTIFLLAIAMRVPIHSSGITRIVKYYTYGLVYSLGVLIISTISIYISRSEHTIPLPYFISNVLTFPLIQMILCLPKHKDGSKYGNINASTSQLNETQDLWIIFGIAIDRIMFFIYLLLTPTFIFLQHF